MAEPNRCNQSVCPAAGPSRGSTTNTNNSQLNDSSGRWNNISNYTAFMDAIIRFMNESWLAVSEIREQSGIPPNDRTPISMSEAEREEKIREIRAKLQEKYQELNNLEMQLANFSGESSGNDSRFQTAQDIGSSGNDSRFQTAQDILDVSDESGGNSFFQPGLTSTPQHHQNESSHYTTGYDDSAAYGAYDSYSYGDTPPVRVIGPGQRLNFSAPDTPPGHLDIPYNDSGIGGCDDYCAGSFRESVSSMASGANDRTPTFNNTYNNSSGSPMRTPERMPPPRAASPPLGGSPYGARPQMGTPPRMPQNNSPRPRGTPRMNASMPSPQWGLPPSPWQAAPRNANSIPANMAYESRNMTGDTSGSRTMLGTSNRSGGSGRGPCDANCTFR